MILLDTKNKKIFYGVVEIRPGLGIYVDQDNRHICTDSQIGDINGDKQFVIIDEKTAKGLDEQSTDNKSLTDSKSPRNMNDIINEKIETSKKEVTKIIPKKNENGAIVIPKWLNDWLKSKDAFYEVDREQILDGRFLNSYGVQWYLGSYFPKSFVEAYVIYSDLLSVLNYSKVLNNKESFSVLDIGCGTGGNTIGLITAIIEKMPNVKSVTIEAYDYCEESIKAFEELIGFFSERVYKYIKIRLKTAVLHLSTQTGDDELSLKDFANNLAHQYDFILTFKMINELVRHANFQLNTVYSEFAEHLSTHLSEIGSLIIEDVSDKINGVYLSKVIGASLQRFVGNTDFKIISPIPCSIKQQECTDNSCYMQRILKVCFESKYIVEEDGKKQLSSGTVSRTIDTQITYRIITRIALAKRIIPHSFTHKYQKVYKRQDAKSTNSDDHFCGPNEKKVQDAFTLCQ